jgi:hypothetical protein
MASSESTTDPSFLIFKWSISSFFALSSSFVQTLSTAPMNVSHSPSTTTFMLKSALPQAHALIS